ncbi:hypothetical protein, partial [Limnospira sp. PMC 1280.21]|uniref:hypothetical protein n=1 Tax=Limnospira sp. PMC 1280.21 TaxID=2981063 RepID=UPI0028EBF75D
MKPKFYHTPPRQTYHWKIIQLRSNNFFKLTVLGVFQNVVFDPELHQRCGVGDDDRRKSDRT